MRVLGSNPPTCQLSSTAEVHTSSLLQGGGKKVVVLGGGEVVRAPLSWGEHPASVSLSSGGGGG